VILIALYNFEQDGVLSTSEFPSGCEARAVASVDCLPGEQGETGQRKKVHHVGSSPPEIVGFSVRGLIRRNTAGHRLRKFSFVERLEPGLDEKTTGQSNGKEHGQEISYKALQRAAEVNPLSELMRDAYRAAPIVNPPIILGNDLGGRSAIKVAIQQPFHFRAGKRWSNGKGVENRGSKPRGSVHHPDKSQDHDHGVTLGKFAGSAKHRFSA
jgi:hypothetical protein